MRPREARETHRTGSQSQKPTRPTGARFKFKIHSNKSKPAVAELSSERWFVGVGVCRPRRVACARCAGARSGFERNGTAGSGFRLWLWVCAHRAGPRRAVPYRVGETATWVCEACDLSPGPGAWLISVSGTVSPLLWSHQRQRVRERCCAPLFVCSDSETRPTTRMVSTAGTVLDRRKDAKSTTPPCAGSTKRLTNRGHVCFASSVMISRLIVTISLVDVWLFSLFSISNFI